jgi:capsular exopolysaccharide synthesis family protein
MAKVTMTDIRKTDYHYTEALKTLRTNLQFSGKEIKTILLTSCYPNEGKSDITLSLCQEMGSIGKRVLLLDVDIRKSVYMSRFRVEESIVGLSQYLSGQVEEAYQLIYHTNFPNVDIVFAGPAAPNPSGLLGTEAFNSFLRAVRNHYDYVFIDTPPIGTIIDAAVVAERCDGAVLVIESESVSYKVAQKAVAQLNKSGCTILGAVLNKVDTRKDKYYSSYYNRYDKYYEKASSASGKQG